MLNMSLGSFQNALSSIYRVITFHIIFQAFFCFLMRIYINQNMFNLSSPQDQVSNFIVNNAILVKHKVNVQIKIKTAML